MEWALVHLYRIRIELIMVKMCNPVIVFCVSFSLPSFLYVFLAQVFCRACKYFEYRCTKNLLFIFCDL